MNISKRVNNWKRRIYDRWLPLYGLCKSKLEICVKTASEHNYPVDFVVTWVDGNDLDWQLEKEKYARLQNALETTNSTARYREWGLLPYWFRAVEKYAPWVHKIYLVTNGQKPEWLNTEYEKLVLIRHSDFMPMEYLPTFASDKIELNLWRIPGLSEHFVYFNDDMFLQKRVNASDFFCGGLPKCYSVMKPLHPELDGWVTGEQRWLNDYAIINDSFDVKQSFSLFPEKFFSYIYTREQRRWNYQTYLNKYLSGSAYQHCVHIFLKSTFSEMWEKYTNLLDKTCRQKFRSPEDSTIYLATLWQIFSGNYSPVEGDYFGKVISLSINKLDYIKKMISSDQYKIICLNDNENMDMIDEKEIIKFKKSIINVFFDKLPKKSKFEK